MNHEIDLLIGLAGSILDGILLEIYQYKGDTHITINDMQISIEKNDFILGCSGDGSIFVRKGKVRLLNDDSDMIFSTLYSIEFCNGYEIDKIEAENASIIISINNSIIEIVNDDDELVIIYNKEKLSFDGAV